MIRKVIRGAGETLITFGLIVLLFATYEVYGKAWQVAQDQKRLDKALEQQWNNNLPANSNPNPSQSAPVPKVDNGDPLTKLYIPALGKHWIVVEGTTLKDIKLAPGHYRESQLPGENGNFAVAGHRTPAIFWNLDRVKKGDEVGVEDANNYYIYTVYQTRIVQPTNVSVVDPNPDNPNDSKPTRKLLTLTTCNPKLDNYERLIIHAELSRMQPKSAGKPSEFK